MRSIIVMIFILFFSSCANIGHNLSLDDNNYYILDLKNKNKISFTEFINQLNDYEIVLLGEEHDMYLHHLAEIKIIKAINKNKAIALEMLSTNKQEKINEVLKNRAKIRSKDIKNALLWDKKWHQKGYFELLNSFFYDDVDILAANLSQDEINMIYMGAENIKGIFSTTKDVRDKIKNIIQNNHKIDNNVLEKLVEIQQYKDRRMADVVRLANDFVILIAGKYHCYKNLGVPLHLKDFNSSKKVAVVSFENKEILDEINTDFADYVWIFKN